MHKKEAINNPKSVEEILIEMNRAYNRNKVPMNSDQSEMSIAFMLASAEGVDVSYEKFKEAYIISGFFKRCDIFPIKYEKRLLVWLAATSIGKITGTLALDDVCMHIFADGLFTKQTVHEFWDEQKVAAPYPDNLIDYPTACASFMPTQRTEPVTYKDH